jgi:NAD(P)-dependent dehydrogenase (short-subunit alcohol dehydrogenase family)
MIQHQEMYDLYCPELNGPSQQDFAARSQASNVLPVPWVEPIDISNAMVFLASDEGRYITGVSLPIDAGVTL